MTINKEFMEICQNVKKPLKFKNAFYTVINYMESKGLDGRELHSDGSSSYSVIKDDLLPQDLYAKEVSIVSSGNEDKVYAHVMDSNGKALYFSCYLNNTPEAYALVAKYAGAFMGLFNEYMYYISVKEKGTI